MLLLAHVCALHPQIADAEGKLRVLFLCTPSVACDTFINRLRGQTSDLAVQVETAVLPIERIAHDDVAAADIVGSTYEASVVVWWRGGALVALTRTHDGSRVLVRPIARTRTLGTADLETGSLVARTAIVATLNNTPVGTPRTVEAATGNPTPLPAPPAPSVVTWGLAPRIGWVAGWDGMPREPSHGVEARLEGRWRRVAVGAMWVERPKVRLLVPQAEGSLASRVVGFVLAYDFLNKGRWTLGVEGRLGWLLTWVDPLSGPFQERLRFVRGYAGAGVRVRREFSPRLAAWVAANVDRVDDPINVGIRGPNSYMPLWYMWSTQPSLGIGLEIKFAR